MELDMIVCQDALSYLKTLPADSVDCVVTSPPYLGQRDYGIDNPHLIGQETSLEDYLEAIVIVFAEVWRVLKSSGVVWLNLGDKWVTSASNYRGPEDAGTSGLLSGRETLKMPTDGRRELSKNLQAAGLRRKSAVGLPHRTCFALVDCLGFILRTDMVWHKTNGKPASYKDRPISEHEYIFMLTKEPVYYFDAAAFHVRQKHSSINRLQRGVSAANKYVNGAPGQTSESLSKPRGYDLSRPVRLTRLMGTVISTATNSERHNHPAAFPRSLIEPFVAGTCPPGGVVLDPFMGSGTTAVVAKSLGRHYLGCEINPTYVATANQRLAKTPGYLSPFASIVTLPSQNNYCDLPLFAALGDPL